MGKSEGKNMEAFWHSAAHVFAEALTEVYPQSTIAIGPPIEQGFHYDFELEKGLKEEDLKAIEKKMKEIIHRKEKMEQKMISIDEAKKMFEKNKYKIEMINDLEKSGEKKLVFLQMENLLICVKAHT